MLEVILSFFSSSGVGALVGLAGSWLTKREERQNVEIRLNHEKEMLRLQNKNLLMQQEHELQVAQLGAQSVIQQGSSAVELQEVKAFAASQTLNQPLSHGFTEFVRGLMRPLITLYLLAIASIVAWHINAYMLDVSGSIKDHDVIEIFRTTLDRIMFLTTTAVTWWFGSRPASDRKQPSKTN